MQDNKKVTLQKIVKKGLNKPKRTNCLKKLKEEIFKYNICMHTNNVVFNKMQKTSSLIYKYNQKNNKMKIKFQILYVYNNTLLE